MTTTTKQDRSNVSADSSNLESTAEQSQNAQARSRAVSAALRVLAVVFAIIPAVMCADYVFRFYVEVPWEDEIMALGTLKAFMEGSLSLQQILLMQVLEHRVGLLLVALYALGLPFKFQSLAWMIENIAVLSAVAFLIFLWARRSVVSKSSEVFWLIPLSWLFLSLRQYEMLVWGFCIDLSIILLLVVSVFLLLERTQRISPVFGTASVLAVASSFFNAVGLLVWPIGFVQIVLGHMASKSSSKLALLAKLSVWSLAAICVVCLVVFTGKSHSHSIPSLAVLKQQGLEMIFMWLMCLGNPLASEPKAALAAGLGLLGMFVFCVVKFATGSAVIRKACIVPLSFCLYWLMAALLITIGRFGAGLDAACLSRYSTNLVLGVVGLYLFCLALKRCGALKSYSAAAMMLALIVPSWITSAQYAEAQGDELHNLRIVAANQVENYRLQSREQLKRTYINQTTFDPAIFPFIEEHKLGLFSLKSLPNQHSTSTRGVLPIPNYLLETINTVEAFKLPLQQSVRVSLNESVIDFRGYAFDFSSRTPCEKLSVCIDSLEIPAAMGIFRRDVSRRYHRNSYLRCGFVATCDPKLIQPGTHCVSLKMKFEGQEQVIDSGHLATIRVE